MSLDKAIDVGVVKKTDDITLEADEEDDQVNEENMAENDENSLKESFRPNKRPQGAGGRPRVEGTMTGGL
eukprot:gene8946-9899_t